MSELGELLWKAIVAGSLFYMAITIDTGRIYTTLREILIEMYEIKRLLKRGKE